MTAPMQQISRAQYQSHAVTTAGPAQLVLMLYDGTLTAIRKARESLEGEATDVSFVHRELTRAQDIVMELTFSLDRERGGAIAGSLGSLYDFCHRQLVNANTAKDPKPLAVVEKVIGDLRETWADAVIPLQP